MKTKTLIVLFLIVTLPLALLIGLGVKVQQQENIVLEHRAQQQAQQQLTLIDNQFIDYFSILENKLLYRFESNYKNTSYFYQYRTEILRNFVQKTPEISHLFVVNSNGERIFPPQEAVSDKEFDFLSRTLGLWNDTSLFNSQVTIVDDQLNTDFSDSEPSGLGANINGRADVSGKSKKNEEAAYELGQLRPSNYEKIAKSIDSRLDERPEEEKIADDDHGWISWFANTQQNIIFWIKDPKDNIVGFELERVRLISDLINLLPEKNSADNISDAYIDIADNNDKSLYSWGTLGITKEDSPLFTQPLSHPLGSWTISYYAKPLIQQTVARQKINLLSLVALVSAALLGLAFLLYREQKREYQLAQQRVNFVSQVSHELKTPFN